MGLGSLVVLSNNVLKDGLQEADGLHEAVAFDGHDHVDGVEVSFAAEATGEVGVGFDGGVEVVAQRTHETEAAVMCFVDDFESIGDKRDDFDAVTELAQVLFGQRV